MSTYRNVIESPVGLITTTVDEQGRLHSLSFRPPEAGDLHPERTRSVDLQIEEYFTRKRRTFELELSPQGTEFQRLVWEELMRIPYGETRSYGQLAAILGRPGASRAVGRANATNPVALVVPCHRVIAHNGALTGFAYGIEIKRRLLAFESPDLFQSGT
jgi:methylated-DNA-[protein]-cysteine S-methyltransferase